MSPTQSIRVEIDRRRALEHYEEAERRCNIRRAIPHYRHRDINTALTKMGLTS